MTDDYREFNGAPYAFHCENCGTQSNQAELFRITSDGYVCDQCDSEYTFDEVHGNLES